MSGGFFDEDVSVGFEGVDGVEGVPVVGRRDDGDLDVLLLEEFAVVFVFVRGFAAEIGDFFGRELKGVAIDITESDDVAGAGSDGFAEDDHAPPAGTDESSAVFFAGLRGGREEGGG